jgi:hypothetical protein
MLTIVVLLVIFQIKHFVADYPLQTPWMLGKFKESGWALPLACHAAVHAWFTYFIVLFTTFFLGYYSPLLAFVLAAFDFAMHFTMDRVKASPKLLGRWKALSAGEYQLITKIDANPADTVRLNRQDEWEAFRDKKLRDNRLFWYALGIDQAVHHLTHYVIIAAMLWS